MSEQPHTTIPSPTSTTSSLATSLERESSSPQLLNIQFHIVSVHGLPLASSTMLTRNMIKRTVCATCTGDHDVQRHTDAVAQADSIWDENMEQ
ncbi:hypothetical protein FPV67DRAFT_1676323 [Lyophyllum atratum]|nr:hypothetical protein FPV67DRAFT_1676323 [Lyophyllum atratum]